MSRVADALPILALLAAVLARIVPSQTVAAHVDLLLAALVLVTALDIDPRDLLMVHTGWWLIAALAIFPLVPLGLIGWGLAQLTHGPTRVGVLSLGLSPTEVASVGLIGLMGGAAELAVATLACSLLLSAVLGPPLLGLLAGGAHHAHVLPLLGRFALVVILPLVAGLTIRGARASIKRHRDVLYAVSSVLVSLLVYGSLSAANGGSLGGAIAISAAFLAVSAAVAASVVHPLGARERPLVLTIGMRDFAVAAALAAAASGPAAAHVAGIYGVLMLLAGASVTGVVRRHARAQPGPKRENRATPPAGRQPGP
jgi:BASS family bile acid:Na+ symporter